MAYFIRCTIFPDTQYTLLEVVPGTAFAAVGVTVAQATFTTFQSGSTGRNLIASVLLLLTRLYVVGLVILLGAVINAVFSNRSRDVNIEPVINGTTERRASGPAVDRDALLADLNRPRSDFEAAGDSIGSRIDGRAVEIARPQRVRIEHSDGFFDLDALVRLVVHWWPENDSSADSTGSIMTTSRIEG